MAKKERNFHGEADFLRHQLRALAKEMGIEIKDTNLMRKEECQARIAELNKEKYRKELEAESEIVIQEISEKNNQITTLEKKELILKKEKQNCIDIILEKDEKIEALKIEIKELQESNEFMEKTIENNGKELLEKEKELQKKNEEISELKAERTSSQVTMEKLEAKIKQSEERTQKSLDSKNDFIDKLQEELNQLRNRKWYQFWK